MQTSRLLPFSYTLAIFVCFACSKARVQIALEASPIQRTELWAVESTVDNRLRLGSRSYVASTLVETFGPSASATTQELVSAQASAFGGESCDPNAQACSSAVTQLPMIPTVATQRSALMIRVCHKIVKQDQAILHAAALVREQAGLVSVTAPTESDVSGAFDLFYTGREIRPDVASDLMGVVHAVQNEGLSTLEQWRFLLGVLCESPGWQIP